MQGTIEFNFLVFLSFQFGIIRNPKLKIILPRRTMKEFLEEPYIFTLFLQFLVRYYTLPNVKLFQIKVSVPGTNTRSFTGIESINLWVDLKNNPLIN
jgi:hypothetical protein